MINLNEDINSLSHFKRNTNEVIEQLETTKRPMVLTVNGKAKVIVQDSEAYQQTLEVIELAESIIGIRKGLEAVKNGEEQPVEKAFNEIYKKHGLSRPRSNIRNQ